MAQDANPVWLYICRLIIFVRKESNSEMSEANSVSQELLKTVESLLDREAIRDLYNHYAWLLDNRECSRISREIFTADAEESHGSGMETRRGTAEIHKMMIDFMSLYEATAHYISNVRAEIHPDGTATAHAYVHAYHWAHETANKGAEREADFVSVGIYLDVLRKDANGWRITSRRRRNLGAGPIGLGHLPTGLIATSSGWGGPRDK